MARAKTKAGKFIKVSPATKGAISEHQATAWLLATGYDVFRNVSPNGRADLLAVNWEAGETIRVDVKSQGFTLEKGKGVVSSASIERDELNKGFDIRYLVVKHDGDCEWYDESILKAGNDNAVPQPTWWIDKKTRQRFLMPGNELTDKDWHFFCHWLLRAYPEYIIPFSEQFVREISALGMCFHPRKIEQKKILVLKKILAHVHGKLRDADAIEEIFT